jgi:hypothetical protein
VSGNTNTNTNTSTAASYQYTVNPVQVTLPSGESTTPTVAAGSTAIPLQVGIGDDASGSATVSWTIQANMNPSVRRPVAQSALRKVQKISFGARDAASSICGSLSASTGTTVNYTPSATGDCQDTVTATVMFEGAPLSSNPTQTFAITDGVAPAITSASSTNFAIGTANSFTVTATGYPAPTFTESGTLPSGVTLSASGLLSGIPAAGSGGSYPITLTASNAVSSATQSFTLIVDAAPAITSASSTTFTAGTAGSFQVTATGSPSPTITESGNLPSGVTFNSATGVLSGTPAAGSSGPYQITFTASNGVTPSATQNFTLNVDTVPAITSASSTTFTESTAGSFNVVATGYPTPKITESGTLPSGVTFSNGVLSGTPAVGSSTGSPYTITFTATNAASSVSQTFTLTVNPAQVAPSITSASSTVFTAGTAGSFTVTATGYPTPTITESGALPSGVTFSNGVLSGTPAAGSQGSSYPITFTASNGIGANATQNFTLIVGTAPAITSASSTTFTVGTAGSFQVTATGYPAPTFSVTSGTLPSGVSLNSTTGVLSGTPAAGTGNTYSFTITASNGATPSATQSFTLTVDAAPVITSASSTTFSENTAGSFTVTATGYPTPITITESGNLPSGVTFSNGVLSGTPAVGSSAGSPYNITFTATNVASSTTQTFSLIVSAKPPHNVSGQVSLVNGGGPLSGASVTLTNTLNNQLTYSQTTDSNGKFTIADVPDASTYTVTLALSASEAAQASGSVFYPASSSIASANGAYSITLSGADLTGINFTAAVGYPVSGTVNYPGGSQNSNIYLTLQNTTCSTCAPQLGTSTTLQSGGGFNIDGVPPGTYTLNAWIDLEGHGVLNAFNPSGSTSVTVSNAAVTANVTLKAPGTSSVVLPAPTMVVSPMEQGFIVYYQPIVSAGMEQPLYYVLQWDTLQSNCQTNPIQTQGVLPNTTGGYYNNVPAGSGNVVILDYNEPGGPVSLGDSNAYNNFQDGTQLYVCMAALDSDSQTLGSWAMQQVIIGAPQAGGNTSTIQFNVNIPASDQEGNQVVLGNGTTQTPLYAGCLDENTGNIYMVSDTAEFTGGVNYEPVNIPNGASCTSFAFLDLGATGLISPESEDSSHIYLWYPGDSYNTNQNLSPLPVNGPTIQNIDLTPDVEMGSATVRTQNVFSVDQNNNPLGQTYNLIFDVHSQTYLPVDVELEGAASSDVGPNVLAPLNFALCTSCYSPSQLGSQSDFHLVTTTAGVPPVAGDTYNLQVTYYTLNSSQNDQVTLSPAVTGVSNAFASGLAVSNSDTPTFTWTYPANATNYTYQLTVTDAVGNVVWQIPAANAMAVSFTSSVSPSITWGSDPTNTTNTPSVASLTSGANYQWSISAIDSNGNADINGNIISAGNIATVQQTFVAP